MNCKPDGTIYEFEEKPKEPKSTLASMGDVYKRQRSYRGKPITASWKSWRTFT